MDKLIKREPPPLQREKLKLYKTNVNINELDNQIQQLGKKINKIGFQLRQEPSTRMQSGRVFHNFEPKYCTVFSP